MALPYVVLSSPRETRANSCKPSRIFFVVRDLAQIEHQTSHDSSSSWTHRRTTTFSRALASPVALISGKPSCHRPVSITCAYLSFKCLTSASITSIQWPNSSPLTLCTKLARSSAKFGMTDRGPSLPADTKMARRICGPKCSSKEAAWGSSGDGKRVVVRRATWTGYKPQEETKWL